MASLQYCAQNNRINYTQSFESVLVTVTKVSQVWEIKDFVPCILLGSDDIKFYKKNLM